MRLTDDGINGRWRIPVASNGKALADEFENIGNAWCRGAELSSDCHFPLLGVVAVSSSDGGGLSLVVRAEKKSKSTMACEAQTTGFIAHVSAVRKSRGQDGGIARVC